MSQNKNIFVFGVECWSKDSLSLPDEQLIYYIKYMKLEQYDGFENNLKIPSLENLLKNVSKPIQFDSQKFFEDCFDPENGAVVKASRWAFPVARVLEIVIAVLIFRGILISPPVTPSPSPPPPTAVVGDSKQALMSNVAAARTKNVFSRVKELAENTFVVGGTIAMVDKVVLPPVQTAVTASIAKVKTLTQASSITRFNPFTQTRILELNSQHASFFGKLYTSAEKLTYAIDTVVENNAQGAYNLGCAKAVNWLYRGQQRQLWVRVQPQLGPSPEASCMEVFLENNLERLIPLNTPAANDLYQMTVALRNAESQLIHSSAAFFEVSEAGNRQIPNMVKDHRLLERQVEPKLTSISKRNLNEYNKAKREQEKRRDYQQVAVETPEAHEAERLLEKQERSTLALSNVNYHLQIRSGYLQDRLEIDKIVKQGEGAIAVLKFFQGDVDSLPIENQEMIRPLGHVPLPIEERRLIPSQMQKYERDARSYRILGPYEQFSEAGVYLQENFSTIRQNTYVESEVPNLT